MNNWVIKIVKNKVFPLGLFPLGTVVKSISHFSRYNGNYGTVIGYSHNSINQLIFLVKWHANCNENTIHPNNVTLISNPPYRILSTETHVKAHIIMGGFLAGREGIIKGYAFNYKINGNVKDLIYSVLWNQNAGETRIHPTFVERIDNE